MRLVIRVIAPVFFVFLSATPVRAWHVSFKPGADIPVPMERPRREVDQAERKKPSSSAKPSIAVLPFDNLSGDPEQEFFSDGLTEGLITTLSKASGLLVIARNSSFAYKGKSVNVQQIASELGVDFVLEGSGGDWRCLRLRRRQSRL